MSWLNNFKIVFKVSLIVALLAIVTLGTVAFATLRMRAMDAASTFMNGCAPGTCDPRLKISAACL